MVCKTIAIPHSKMGTLERQGYTTIPRTITNQLKLFETSEPTSTCTEQTTTATTIPPPPTPFSNTFPFPILCIPQCIECAKQPSTVPKLRILTTTCSNLKTLQPIRKPSTENGNEQSFLSTALSPEN